MKNILKTIKGFTLIEIIIAIGLSSMVLLFLTRLFSVSLSSYNLQEQLADMNQNAKFTIKELGDLLMQAGADMQLVSSDTLDRDTIIIQDGNNLISNGFTIKINPRGGFFQIPQSISSPVCSVLVDDASAFEFPGKMERIPGANSSILKVKTYSLISCNTNSNFVVFSPADVFSGGDAIVSYNRHHYYLKGTSLCVDNDTNVIAENIDSLAITFLDINKNPVLNWKSMWSAQLYVRARTLLPDKRYNGYPDHYRRIVLTHEIRLRNKVDSGNP